MPPPAASAFAAIMPTRRRRDRGNVRACNGVTQSARVVQCAFDRAGVQCGAHRVGMDVGVPARTALLVSVCNTGCPVLDRLPWRCVLFESAMTGESRMRGQMRYGGPSPYVSRTARAEMEPTTAKMDTSATKVDTTATNMQTSTAKVDTPTAEMNTSTAAAEMNSATTPAEMRPTASAPTAVSTSAAPAVAASTTASPSHRVDRAGDGHDGCQ